MARARHCLQDGPTALRVHIGRPTGFGIVLGVIEPRVGFVRDSFVSMAYILAGLAERGGTLSEWVATLPRYEIVKDKLTCPREQVTAL